MTFENNEKKKNLLIKFVEDNNRVLEEVINTSIHGFGAVISLVGLAVMMVMSYNNDIYHMISSFIYGMSLVLLYSASTMLHNNLSKKEAKRIYNLLDHCAIYLLIAGTYTPFLMITLRTGSGMKILSIVWTLALVGILYQIKMIGKYKVVSTMTYLMMGWIAIFFIKPLIAGISFNGFILLLMGGLSYTIGSFFYIFDNKMRFNHAVWHIFVLLGTFFHFLTITLYVI